MVRAKGAPPGKSSCYILLLVNPVDADACLGGSANDTGYCALSCLVPVVWKATIPEPVGDSRRAEILFYPCLFQGVLNVFKVNPPHRRQACPTVPADFLALVSWHLTNCYRKCNKK